MHVLAGLSLVGAIILQLIGLERYQQLMNWWLGMMENVVRLSMLIVILFGGALIWLML
jgi:hypothetical protein